MLTAVMIIVIIVNLPGRAFSGLHIMVWDAIWN